MIDKNADDDFNDDITDLKAKLAAAENDENDVHSSSKSPSNRKRQRPDPLIVNDEFSGQQSFKMDSFKKK